MIQTQLAKAISTVVAGVALSSGAMASTTMYNTYTTTAALDTDGWTRVAADANGYASGPASKGNSGLIVKWAGTTAGKLPFDYTGSSHLNWAVQLTGEGDSAEISAADSLARYAIDAEIDTGGGAWNDNGKTPAGDPTATGPTGWRHQTDIGIIKSDVTQKVTINLTTVSNLFSRFGVTVFEGVDTNTGNYSHHGAWNRLGSNPPLPFTANNPFGTTGLINIGYSDNVDGTNGYTFIAKKDQAYSLYLGGVGFSHWAYGVDRYVLDITTSPVPVPGTVWLFGSAMAGLISFGRRKAA